jgi:hypothetical protein
MATWSSYWKIITPAKKQEATVLKYDSNDQNYYGAAFNTVAAYSQLIKGSGSRIARYMQYDGMDLDVDIARALDIIAEEMSSVDEKSGLPFEIDYQVEQNQEVSEITVTTLRAALRHWSNIHDLNNKIFRISRCLIKYGDCFFVKHADNKKWEFIDTQKVIGIEIDETGEKVAFHVREESKTDNINKNTVTTVYTAPNIIHFTLSDDMGESAPFGESILQAIFKTFKQLSMLEDASIIYRIVRAPERRVFYIDVGNMPQQRVKQYLESIKNDIRQKRVPNTGTNGGKDQVDSVYNPNSIQEDYFFPVSSEGKGSRIETLPGGENVGENSDIKYFRDKLFRGLRVPTSYMSGVDNQGAQVNDGKMGIAYVEEQRFANFVKRLQNQVEKVMDAQFKEYLDFAGINIDHSLFKIKLPDPQNFALYRQAALDADLINTFKSIEDVKYISKRLMMKRFLGFSEDEIQMNEMMLKQERAIADDASLTDLQQMYDPAFFDNRDAIKLEEKKSKKKRGAPAPDEGGDEGLDMGDDQGGDEGLDMGADQPDQAGLDMGGGDQGGGGGGLDLGDLDKP